MKFYRVIVADRGDHTEVRGQYPVYERPRTRPVFQKRIADELRRLADLLESEKWTEGGTATGREAESRSLLLETKKGA